jgi:integrase
MTLASLTKERAQLWKASLKAKGNSGNTVNHRLSTLIDLYKWAIDHGHATENPFQGLKVKAKTAKDRGENYKPFTEDELKAIFSPAPYAAKFGHRPDYHWLPLLALFSGARLEEVGGMKAADVMVTDGVHVLSVIRRKTKDSRRKIPVHPTLIRLGFLDYAAAVQASGEVDLFPNNRKAGDKGSSLGDAFGEYLDALGITDPEKVFHSFRSTVISQFGARKAHPAHSRQIVGHAKGDIHDTVYTHLQYGDGLRELADTVAVLSYPFLDFDALKASDPAFTGYLTKWKAGANHRERLAQSRANNATAKAARRKTP